MVHPRLSLQECDCDSFLDLAVVPEQVRHLLEIWPIKCTLLKAKGNVMGRYLSTSATLPFVSVGPKGPKIFLYRERFMLHPI